MSTIPQLIKLASGDAIYANQALIKAIKQHVAQPSDQMKAEDYVYFFSDVEFRRDLLSISQDKFFRVIKMEKATVVAVNSNMSFPNKYVILKDGKINPNCPENESDDILYNISAMGEKYLTTMRQWRDLLQLSNKPRIVFENELLSFINSGVVIDESNYSNVQELLSSDQAMGAKTIDTCDIQKSFLYILSLLYFEKGFNTLDTSLFYRCQNVKNYLSSKGITNSIPERHVLEMLKVEFIKDRLTTSVISKTVGALRSFATGMSDYIDSVNVDMKWKQ